MPPLPRRAITIPGVFLGLGLALVAAPLWAPIAAGIDLLRGAPSAVLRTGGVAVWMLLCEAVGILAAGALWVWHVGGRRNPGRHADRLFGLQCRWAGALLRGARALAGFDVVLEPGDALPSRGPVLLLMRHASMGDTLLPAHLLSIPHGIRLRYVLKRELLWDPCLDLVGHRLPNVFIDREGPDAAAAVSAVRDLARGLGACDGVMIYPEGTRHSPAKRRRALERLRERDDPTQVAHAEALRHLLPPRLGGTLALLDAFAETGEGHVVVCGHHGFEGSARLAELLNGSLTGARVRVRCWTTPVAELPDDASARRAWLLDAWRRMDDWIESVSAGSTQA